MQLKVIANNEQNPRKGPLCQSINFNSDTSLGFVHNMEYSIDVSFVLKILFYTLTDSS